MQSYPLKESYTADDLREIIRVLRSPEGCPWDRVQTHESIRKNLLEECYETADAIDKSDMALLKEELGDVLLQVYLHGQIAQDNGAFTLEDVTDGICRKLLERHPHVFGNIRADDGEAALAAWDEAKRKAKGQQPGSVPMLDVPKTLPALMRAQKVQQKAKLAGMDFPGISNAAEQLVSKLNEFIDIVKAGNDPAGKLGDILFSAVNVVRISENDSEELLTRATEKFIARFIRAEKLLDKPMSDCTQEELDEVWEKAAGLE
ncbi:MAG: nucleoside triphosphate pyrophosphohydrolase [Oscillospiraceae bacterium]|nr:nucleoside triphosphate pyrophosphohydrolase [Oscillospiraceae bacterium]